MPHRLRGGARCPRVARRVAGEGLPVSQPRWPSPQGGGEPRLADIPVIEDDPSLSPSIGSDI